MPEFVVDLQTHAEPHFARRVLEKTILDNGEFREDKDDHRYRGIENAWIRYVSRGTSGYRVIYIRGGTNIYLYRAGEHSVEDRLVAPKQGEFDSAIPVGEAEDDAAARAATTTASALRVQARPAPNRFLRNDPNPEIQRTLLSRRKLPHKDIWLVAPFINSALLQPTAKLGRMLFDQVEDGAKILLITAPPRAQEIEWLERLAERDVAVYFYPRLHSKLFCFVLDESRKYERGLPEPSRMASLLLIGSANLTAAGLALGEGRWNEELCYSVPETEIAHIETYVTTLITRGYDLKEVRALRARGQWHRLENDKW